MLQSVAYKSDPICYTLEMVCKTLERYWQLARLLLLGRDAPRKLETMYPGWHQDEERVALRVRISSMFLLPFG